MKVVITGANSAVGQAILRCASEQGGSEQGAAPATLVAAVRSQRAAEQIQPLLANLGNGSSAVRLSYDHPGSLDAAFRGASAIIHLAGVLVEHPGSTYEQANVASVRSAVEAAKRCGAEKF